jgi:Fungal chitosanase of glycosyl hydrolase group 75
LALLRQLSDDPFPGYYVSATDLVDRTKLLSDPSRYVDASRIPYIVLPSGMDKLIAAHPGDFAIVFNLQNFKSSPAIFADTGLTDRIGEGSIALAENLGLWSNARNGGTARGILYLVFPGSGNGHPRPIEEINVEAEKLLQEWGGNNQLKACGIQ